MFWFSGLLRHCGKRFIRTYDLLLHFCTALVTTYQTAWCRVSEDRHVIFVPHRAIYIFLERVRYLDFGCRARLKRDGTRAETRFGLSEKWTSPFKSAGESVKSNTGSRGARISGQTMNRPRSEVECKSSGYPLQSPVSPFTSPPTRHHVPSRFERPLPTDAQENCFKRSIKIYMKTTPTCFGIITIIRERTI